MGVLSSAARILIILFLLSFYTNSAFARLSYLGEWQQQYAQSSSNAVACQLCHQSAAGGDGWNAYGWAVRAEFLLNGGQIVNALVAVEGQNSDSDPSNSTNVEEINLNTQPGWTDSAVNTIYFKDGSLLANQPPPDLSTTLDPQITLNPDIDISPALLDFGNVVLGNSLSLNLTVNNNGDSDLLISAIDFCSASTEFSIISIGSTQLAPNQSTSIVVRFNPTGVGLAEACLRISSNDPDQSQLESTVRGQGIDVSGELLDVDLLDFSVSTNAKVGDNAITIHLSLVNSNTVSGLAKARVTGTLSGNQIYSEDIIFESGPTGSQQNLVFPEFYPFAAGDIQWSATVVDQNTDLDQSTAVTSVSTPALADPIPESIPEGRVEVALEPVATGLIAPNYATHAPGIENQLYVVDQPGQVWRVNLTTRIRYLFMDVSTRLTPLGIFGPGTFDERGLLGLAFHPNYAVNGLIYTYTSEPKSGAPDFPTTMPSGLEPNHQSIVTEWKVINHTQDDGFVDMSNDSTSGRRELMRIDQPQFNHNGGALAFGLDGKLYVVLGDGGGADDKDGQNFIGGPIVGHGDGNAQDNSNLLGTIIRIDPLGSNSLNGRYGIPIDNPFVSNPSMGLTEIYAWGLRNAFRISFDRKTGVLYAADVGQNHIEEVNIIEKGGNYGWNLKEGSFFFNANRNYPGFVHNEDPGNLAALNLIDPIMQYDHDEGISVIGGFVYRGKLFKQLKGSYVFGDWSKSFSLPSGRLFYQYQTSDIREFVFTDRAELGFFLNGFGQDFAGELYVLGNKTGTPFANAGLGTGQVLKMVPGTKQSGSGK